MQVSNEVEASRLSFNEVQERRDASAKVMFYTAEYRAAHDANVQDRELCRASNELYVGVNKNHWTAKSVEYLNDMERAAHTYNIAKVEADKVIGQIINNPHKSKFAAINQDDVSKVNIVDSLYEYDDSRGKFKKHWNKFVKDVIIHTGVMEMYVDYRHSRLGNISRRTLSRVDECEWSGNWKSGDIQDCSVFYKITWKTAREIKDTWVTKSSEIDQSINMMEEHSGSTESGIDPNDIALTGDLYIDNNGRYKVIEACYMQKVAPNKRNENKIAEFKEENSNPDTYILQDNSPIVVPEYTSICKVITFAPGVGIGLVLQEGNHPVQIGRLPYLVASADITNGVRQGIITGMIDAQISLNKKISMQTGNQISSSNGGILFDEDLFKDDAEETKFIEERTKTGATFKTASGIRISDHITPIPTSPMPPDLQLSIDWHMKFLAMYPNNTDAISGNSGGANESNVLFESKKGQAKVAHAGLVGVFEDIKDEDAEGYFLLGKVIYAGPHREMRSAKSGDKIDINKPVHPTAVEGMKERMPNATVNYYLAGLDGELIASEPGNASVAIFNEIKSLPRHNIIIEKSELGLDQKQQTLSLFYEMSQRSKNPVAQSIYEGEMAPLLEIPQEATEKLKKAAEINFLLQVSQVEGQIIANKANNAQAELTMLQAQMQVQQLQAQIQGQPQGPPPEESAADAPVGDARSAANGPGQGNIPDAVANGSSGANNISNSDA